MMKRLLLILIIAAIICGAVFMLMVMDVIPAPSFMKSLPVIGDKFFASETDLTPAEKQEKARQTIQDQLDNRDKELAKLEADFNEASQKLKKAEQEKQELQAQVVALNEQLVQLKLQNTNQQAAYKDLASYFAEMKAKDAADILSRQKDQDIIGVLEEMPSDIAAEILQNMNRDKAASITKQMLTVSP